MKLKYLIFSEKFNVWLIYEKKKIEIEIIVQGHP